MIGSKRQSLGQRPLVGFRGDAPALPRSDVALQLRGKNDSPPPGGIG